MGATSYEYKDLQVGTKLLATSYDEDTDNSGSIDVRHADEMNFIFDFDLDSGGSSIQAKLQVYNNLTDDWHDVFRNNSGTGELEEISFTIDASGGAVNNYQPSIVVDVRGLGHIRWCYKTTGAAGACADLWGAVTKQTR